MNDLTRFGCATLAALTALVAPQTTLAAGTWRTVTAAAPAASGGAMLLLSDGTVMAKSTAGPQYGNAWNRLTPDRTGNYATGTWSTLAAMGQTRLYFSSQVLRDGRVYVAGGEYGTGLANAEVYNPLTNSWAALPAPGANVSDANSEMLPDGRVLQALVAGTLRSNVIFNPTTNTYSAGPTCVGIHNESAWVKLADSSILMIDRHATTSERYRPTTNTWVADATVPVALYDDFGFECGGALLLPNGRAFFIGATGNTAIYTPGAGGANGTWAAGAVMPLGSGTPDAPMAMLPNGKILCLASAIPTSANHFPSPTLCFEYDYLTNTFQQIFGPTGLTYNSSSFVWTFLNLPTGQILAALQGSSTYWIYTPDGTPLAAGKPTVTGVTRATDGSYTLTGTLFNGISAGSTYGDDWQMNTNYPIVRLAATNGSGNVYYTRTFNWNLTGVQTGSTVTTTQMTIPGKVPYGTYSLYVTANGIASDARGFWYPKPTCPADIDFDGAVTGGDLAMLLTGWGTAGGVGGLGDIDGDGTLGGGDLSIMLNAWGVCPP